MASCSPRRRPMTGSTWSPRSAGTARRWGEPAGRAAGLGASTTPILTTPAGTGNSSYRELFGMIAWEDLLASALAGAADRAVDLNRIQPSGELSLLGFSAGWV